MIPLYSLSFIGHLHQFIHLRFIFYPLCVHSCISLYSFLPFPPTSILFLVSSTILACTLDWLPSIHITVVFMPVHVELNPLKCTLQTTVLHAKGNSSHGFFPQACEVVMWINVQASVEMTHKGDICSLQVCIHLVLVVVPFHSLKAVAPPMWLSTEVHLIAAVIAP